MRLVFFGEQPKFYLISLKAHKEFLDMVPNRIDRSDQMKYSRGRIGKDGLGQTPTNDKSKLIRSEFIKAIGFNQISNRIPDIEEIFERSLDTWPIGEEIIISEKLKDVTFEVITLKNLSRLNRDARNLGLRNYFLRVFYLLLN